MINIKDYFDVLNRNWNGSFRDMSKERGLIEQNTGLEIGKINIDYHYDEQRAAMVIIDYISQNHDWSLLPENIRQMQEEKLSLLCELLKGNIVNISQIENREEYHKLFKLFFHERKESRSYVFLGGEIDYASLLKNELFVSEYEEINSPRIEGYL